MATEFQGSLDWLMSYVNNSRVCEASMRFFVSMCVRIVCVCVCVVCVCDVYGCVMYMCVCVCVCV